MIPYRRRLGPKSSHPSSIFQFPAPRAPMGREGDMVLSINRDITRPIIARAFPIKPPRKNPNAQNTLLAVVVRRSPFHHRNLLNSSLPVLAGVVLVDRLFGPQLSDDDEGILYPAGAVPRRRQPLHWKPPAAAGPHGSLPAPSPLQLQHPFHVL